MNYLDLFSGIGGFHLGLEQAGFKFDWVGSSEINKYATQIYRRHFPDAEELGSIIDIRPENLPRINLITFGFPCQDLSVAGKKRGLSGERSGLFFEAMRIVEATQPDVFIFENVKGLFSSQKGRDFQTVLQTIADLGIYECEGQLLNTRWFLPQNRERFYFIGHRRGRSRPKVFPFRESDFNVEGEGEGPKDGLRVNTIDSNYHKGPDGKRTVFRIASCIRANVFDTSRQQTVIAPCIRANHHNTADVHFIKEATPKAKRAPLKLLNRNGKKTDGDYAFTVDSASTGGFQVGSEYRRPTPTECCRLQGFPDDWLDGLSDTQKYKCIGNAVSVPVVKVIGERLLKTDQKEIEMFT